FAVGHGMFSVGRDRDGSDRTHVRTQARLPIRPQPGIPGAGRFQRRRWIWPWFSCERWHVAIAGERERGRAHVPFGIDRVDFNAEYVRDRFLELVNQRGAEVKLAVFYLGMVPAIDLAGAELLAELHRSLTARGIGFRIAAAHGRIREALRRSGFEGMCGPVQ